MNIKEKIEKILDKHIDIFSKTLKEEDKDKCGELFAVSKNRNDFNKQVYSCLVAELINANIKAEDMDNLMNEFGIFLDGDEANEIIGKITKSKPAGNPPDGQQYVWDNDAQEWILVSKT
jgi:CRISPR/Cas system-associated protein Cas10 (large subunit of type III CRISPR-Cas system)